MGAEARSRRSLELSIKSHSNHPSVAGAGVSCRDRVGRIGHFVACSLSPAVAEDLARSCSGPITSPQCSQPVASFVNCKPWEGRQLPRLDRFKRPGARPRCQTRELCISACAPVGIGRHVVACTVLVNQGC